MARVMFYICETCGKQERAKTENLSNGGRSHSSPEGWSKVYDARVKAWLDFCESHPPQYQVKR